MNKIFTTFICMVLHTALVANIGPNGFRDYLNYYFVETGTFGGGGIIKALEAGFQEIRSIDCDYNNVSYARQNLGKNKNVKIRLGDSATDLWMLIKGLDKPITFWLDAHVFPPYTDGRKNCPLIEELEQIKKHPIKTHTILIDDMSCAGTAAFDFLTKDDLIAKILEINPEYQISYIDGGDQGEAKDNIMVAIIP